MVKQILPIQFIPTHVQPHAKASQSDTEERVFEFHCYTDDDVYNIPPNSIVMIKGAKPDGASFLRSASFSENIVTVICSESMTDVAGEIPCELVVTTSDGTIHSSNFILDVEGEPFNESAVTPSDFSAFEDILQQVTEKAIDVTEVVKYTDITNDPTQSVSMQKVLDAVEKNPDVVGSIAYDVSNLSDEVGQLTADVNSFNTKAKLTGGFIEVNRGEDLNTMVTPGEYYIPNTEISNSLVNSPITGLPGRLTVEAGGQWKTDPEWVRQTVVATTLLYSYTRYSTNTGASWTPWNCVFGTVGAEEPLQQDANQVYDDGAGLTNRIRVSNHGSNGVNTPNASEGGHVITLRNNDNYGAQLDISDRNIWYRRRNGGTWSEWSAISSLLGRPVIGSFKGYTSLDQFVEPGYYYLHTNQGITDLPEGINGNLLVLREIETGNAFIQVYRRIGTAGVNDWAIYIRAFQEGSGWSPWISYSDDSRTKALWGSKDIPENADLNTYVTPGEYYVPSAEIAATIKNIPQVNIATGAPSPGRLTVERSISNVSGAKNIRQTYYNHTNVYCYWIRTSTNSGSTWTKWIQHGVQTQSFNNTTAFSVPNNAWTKAHEIPVQLGPGIYLLDIHVRFDSNATGLRGLSITGNNDTTPDPVAKYENTGELVPANSGFYTNLSSFRMINVGASTTKFNVSLYQSSGAALNAIIYVFLAKIS